jgi:hypothetical protein
LHLEQFSNGIRYYSRADLLCFKYERIVAADNTVQFGPHRIQLLPGKERRSYARATVEVHEHFDGSLTIHYAGKLLAATKAPPEAPKLRSRNGRLRLSAPSSVQTEGEPLPDERPAAASRPRNDHP